MGMPPITLGGGDTVTPGQTPGTTPPFVPSPGGGADPTQQINTQAQKILQAIAQASQRKQMTNTAVPGAITPQDDSENWRNIGMNTANPNAWSKQRFAAGISTNIKNAIAKQKQDQLLKAEGDWSYLQSSLNELYQAQQSGDQQAIAAAQKKVDVTVNDPKKLKNMAKALNQDWLNPEKTTVYGEALKNVANKTEQTEQQKSKAKQGLMGIFKQLMQRKQQPQLSPEQTQAMGREIQAKAPVTSGAQSMGDLEKQASAVESLARAQKELRATPEKYETKVIKDEKGGEKLVAIDKTDPTKPYIEIKSASGETAKKGEKQYVDDGKLEVIAGIPTGRVRRGGKWIAPGQAGYTKEDATAVNKGLDVQGLSQAQKEKLAQLRGSSYARAAAVYRFKDVVDKETGEVAEVSAIDMAKNPGRYTGATDQEKVSARDAIHTSLNTNFDKINKDLDALPNGLDTESQAIVAEANKHTDPDMIETLLFNKVKQGAPDAVIEYLSDMKAMQEDILTMRTVGGMGQGSDQMRSAITRTIIGPGTSSVKEAKMQMKAAKRTLDALFSGRPRSPLPGTGGEGGGKGAVTLDEAKSYLQKAGGDKAKARELAKADGRTF